jgi:lipid-binding SYLF domain-containing protein
MKSRPSVRRLLAGAALLALAGMAHSQAREEGRLLLATQVLEELRAQRDQYIPDRLLERAYGIAVFPDVNKGAFLIGGRYGHGALVVRDKEGRFSSPVFVTLAGGSFGWQWGVQQADVVLVFTTPKGVERIADGKMTLGADASVAAGPVGRQTSAATDATFKAEVYSYSRSRGLFAGLALDGSAITMDHKANTRFYGGDSGVTTEQILAGNVSSDAPAVERFLAAIEVSTVPAAREASSAQTPSKASNDTDTRVSRSTKEAQTFPMEDTQPGAEPR